MSRYVSRSDSIWRWDPRADLGVKSHCTNSQWVFFVHGERRETCSFGSPVTDMWHIVWLTAHRFLLHSESVSQIHSAPVSRDSTIMSHSNKMPSVLSFPQHYLGRHPHNPPLRAFVFQHSIHSRLAEPHSNPRCRPFLHRIHLSRRFLVRRRRFSRNIRPTFPTRQMGCSSHLFLYRHCEKHRRIFGKDSRFINRRWDLDQLRAELMALWKYRGE